MVFGALMAAPAQAKSAAAATALSVVRLFIDVSFGFLKMSFFEWLLVVKIKFHHSQSAERL
jgi:hypothetical protein